MSVSRRLAVVMVMLVVVDAVSGDSQWCQQVVVAVAKNSTWTYNTAIDTLKWVTGTGVAQPVPQCQVRSYFVIYLLHLLSANSNLLHVTLKTCVQRSCSGSLRGVDQQTRNLDLWNIDPPATE